MPAGPHSWDGREVGGQGSGFIERDLGVALSQTLSGGGPRGLQEGMWGGLSWEEETLPASHPLGEGDPSVPGSLRVQGTDRQREVQEQAGAGSQVLTLLLRRAQWEGYEDSSGRGGPGPFNFPGRPPSFTPKLLAPWPRLRVADTQMG